ncbi:hypothetical protein [Streptomyces albireticuli]|uniref:hypothetical protein n=1 Tax=Streptomyces albireticuli TaxID=1940 RepID=UPI0036BFA4DB
MADTTTQAEETPAAAAGPADRKALRLERRLARHVRAFAKSHGGTAEGQLAHIARGTTRIALVGANGEWGVLVAPSMETARKAAEIAGLTLHDEFDGEFAAKVRTGPYEWTRMAGLQLGGPANN